MGTSENNELYQSSEIMYEVTLCTKIWKYKETETK